MLFRYETHTHCSGASLCGINTCSELVRAYHKAGYAGLVLTDHFIFGNTSVDRSLPWPERMERYYNAFLEGKEEAEKLDFDLIFGIEHAYGDGKEMLLYGVELDFLLANPDIPDISIDLLARRVKEWGGVVIQAHPYRCRSYVNMAVGPRADIVDGVEVYNAGNQPGEDALALELSGTIKDCIITSGGDVHSTTDPRLGAAGIVLPYRVKNSREFAEALKRREHQYIIDRKILDVIKIDHLT